MARRRGQASDLGGFVDLLADFVVYSLVPVACAVGEARRRTGMMVTEAEGVGGGEEEEKYEGVWRDIGLDGRDRLWLAVALLEAAIHVNNFVLFYVAAVVEKRKAEGGKEGEGTGTGTGTGTGMRTRAGRKEREEKQEKQEKELTSVAMRPALIEGFESGALFTAMLARPQSIATLASVMAVLVFAGTVQRVWWLVPVLR